MHEKNLKIGYLLDFYGDALSERKRNILDMYYNEDFSLSEIADGFGVSRQAVSKWENGEAMPELSKLEVICQLFGVTPNELMGYEEKLHMLQRKQERVAMLKELQDTLEGIKNLTGDAVKDPLCSACEKVVRLLQREE